MTTSAFVSSSADGLCEIGAPLVSAGALVAGLGTHPSVTIPWISGRGPDVDKLWQWLAEPAEFFGIAIPGPAALRRALDDADRQLPAAAVTVIVVELAGTPQFLVTGMPIDPVGTRSVRLRTCALREPVPYWRQMAARTTSRAEELLTARQLAASGHADIVPTDGQRIGAPLLGALVCQTPSGRVGLGAERLQWMRDDLATLTDEPIALATVTATWWVSPNFETCPVATIGDVR